MTKDHLSPDSTAQIEDIAWIETVHPEEATGYVKSLYEGFQKQRGWVSLFNTLMYGPSGLTRSQKEMIAVVVSAGNQCHY